MSMSRPAREGYTDHDRFADKRTKQLKPMEVIVVNTGPYLIEWETRNRHSVGINREYKIEPNGGLLTDEYADFIVLKFGDFREKSGTPGWASMMRKVSQKNRGGCIPFVEIWSKDAKGRKGQLLWDGKEQFKEWLNSKEGQRYLFGGKKMKIPERIMKMTRNELIKLSIKARFPLDCIREDIKVWSNIRIARVLATKCPPEYLEDILGMSLADLNDEIEGENDGTTLSGTGTKGSGQD